MSLRRAAFVALLATGPVEAADARRWTVEPEGVTFEATSTDLRAWAGRATGTPAFSVSALIAARKKEFDDYAREQARELEGPDPPQYAMTISDQTVTYEPLSIVGPILSYRETAGGYTAGTAHPTGSEVVRVRDLSRQDASPVLTDLFPEKQVVEALKADRWLRTFANPARGFERATTLAQLVAALDTEWPLDDPDAAPDGPVDVSFDESFGAMFYFHHVEKDRVAVRILVPPGSEWANRVDGPQEVGVLLPIPEALRAHVDKARRGEAGFLAGNRKALGPLKYQESWEVDILTLVRKP